MSSVVKQIFIQNLVLQSQVINVLTEGVAVGQDLYDANGNKLDNVQPMVQLHAYTKQQLYYLNLMIIYLQQYVQVFYKSYFI